MSEQKIKNFTNILSSNCEIIKLPNFYVYPIFKNGRSSITEYQRLKKYKCVQDEQIKKITENIVIFLRDPKDRFVSGVHTYLNIFNDSKIDKNILKKIEDCTIVDKHFTPQILWLLHLFKFYRGTVDIKPVQELYNIIPLRAGPWTNRKTKWIKLTTEARDKILSMNYKKFIKDDTVLIEKYLGKKVELKKIIEEFY